MSQRAKRINGLNWPKVNVLILDANQRPALAITRSLGKRGIPVIVADETEQTLSGSSKYCSESFVYPSPYTQPESFLDVLIDESNKRNIKIIFPVTDITTYLLLKNREKLKAISIPFASFDAFEQLTNKCTLFKLAQELSIPIPYTYYVNKYSSLSTLTSTSALDSFSTSTSALASLKFPVVLKPFRSRIPSNGKWISTSIAYANSLEELKGIIETISHFREYPFLIQEYVEGEGRGIFALYNHGKPITFFAHRRIREKPPSGGVSVLSESLEVNPKLKEYARRLFDYVGWHGVAMMEFKVSKDGKPYLMEVNARFWGSLQLAIDSGVDFPWLLYEMAIGNSPQEVNGYKVGLRSRWLLGDLDHLYLKFKNNGRITSKFNTLIDFFNFFDKRTKFEINRFVDLKPFFFEIRRYFIKS